MDLNYVFLKGANSYGVKLQTLTIHFTTNKFPIKTNTKIIWLRGSRWNCGAVTEESNLCSKGYGFESTQRTSVLISYLIVSYALIATVQTVWT